MSEYIHKCLARQYSDQMVCHECALVWDINDEDKPECGAKSIRVVRTNDVNVKHEQCSSDEYARAKEGL